MTRAAGTPDADARMTAERSEVKLLVPRAKAPALFRAIDSRLEPHAFSGPGATSLPGAHFFTTTVYFDTPGRDLFRAANERREHLKLRAREYYSVHPSLAQVARSHAELVRYRPAVWLELKHKRGQHVTKQRLEIPKRDVPRFFAEGVVTAELLELQRAHFGDAAERVMEEVSALCRELGAPLSADSIVNYRRRAWQSPEGDLRVTLDQSVAAFHPPADLWTRTTAMVRESLGTPASVLDDVVAEVKRTGPMPEWLDALLAELSLTPTSFSKFVFASGELGGNA